MADVVTLHPAGTVDLTADPAPGTARNGAGGAEPGAGRWRPLRAGLLNVWRYADEVFRFDHGRLLLRGQNGSGKSMALELLFPFLFDANTHPGRLSSAVKTRGGLYDRFMTGQREGNRVGYLWLEMERSDRPDVHFTCGARLSASAASRRVECAWFTTDLRVGEDLSLLNEHRVALTRAALGEALGSRGVVHPSADAYRDTVRQTLFPGQSRAQYDAMILALLALRREKVSQDLTPQKLSEVLTAALPPVDDQELHGLAEGFEKLDRRRENLERLGRDIAQVDSLARAQRRYSRAVLATVAATVRSAESDRDNITRRAREAAAGLAEATGQRDQLDQASEAGRREQARLAAEATALRRSDAYRQGESLEALRSSRDETARQLERAAARLAEVTRRAGTWSRREQEAAERAVQAERNLAGTLGDLRAQADLLGAAAVIDTLDAGEATETLAAWSRTRRRHVDEVRSAAREHGRAVERRTSAEELLERERAGLDQAAGANQEALVALDAAVEAFAGGLVAWAGTCQEIEVLPTTAADLGARAGEPPAVALAIERLADAARFQLLQLRADAERDLAGLDTALAEAQAEHDRLAAGELILPPAPPWRSGRPDRAEAPGVAALWELVDVAPGQDGGLDGIEAALEASGLLDALVSADGTVRLADGQADLFVVAPADPPQPTDNGNNTSNDPSTGTGNKTGTGTGNKAGTGTGEGGEPTLAGILQPLAGSAVPPAVIGRVLSSLTVVDSALAVGRGSGPVGPNRIGRDGSFAVGALSGRAAPRPTRWLGAAARERDRLRRLAEAEAELARLAGLRSSAVRAIDDLDRRAEVVQAERDAAPSGEAVTTARAEADRAELRLADSERRVLDATRGRDEAEQVVRDRQRQLAQVASRYQLPTSDDGLDTYANQILVFDQLTAAFANRRADHERAAGTLADTRASLADAEADRALAERDHDDLSLRHRQLSGEYEALQQTVGADYAAIAERIATADREQQRLAAEERQQAAALRELLSRIGRLEERVASVETDREQAETARAASHDQFRAAVVDGLVADAGLGPAPELATATDVLEAARALAARLPTDRDEQALPRALSTVQQRSIEAGQQLGGRVEITCDPGGHGWWLLRATKDGMRRTVSEVAAALAADHEAAQAELDEQERRLFEDTLTGQVRATVAGRIRRANQLVDRINGELARVKTAAAKVQVRLLWEVDPEQPPAVQEARRLLLRDSPAESDREALYSFFRARIEQAQADSDGASTWEDRLRAVLDYRQWHRFTFRVAHRDWEGFQPATSNRLQRLSTGERSMALHLPMLASIAAHYDHAGGSPADADAPGSPRLVLLDELFVGVDADNRDQLFALFVTWDLDAVFTSDHEWCAYQSLDGIAMHHLHAEGDEPVTTTRFVWTGAERILEPA